ncbi:hypothetical protein HOU03_gp176 [Caulobacter phage CcrSC]|uniref:Uncharacterized protein n=1 Tax=Caulobacter phage CcrSC TaxID=2283272 RepID=A0A385EGK7_9CAUD|nr:hypothetical protein HOU03_gp010 [Caulobacter phage CcrSC]YP_009810722.1 hypothetical protein HOU03_gp176 [Caulobacter phage CcrSC]AXQ69592.1 hypothetical protein CcrSC_gp010 [Caulobacter phage CcrSC]AXQ70092.1 hypothetical protein CcrSC_gp510 [Caulobacter phage CcrSC]
MALVTESFVVDLACGRALTNGERRMVAAVIDSLLDPHFKSTAWVKGGDHREAVHYCDRVTPYSLHGENANAARVRTEALTTRDHDAPVLLSLSVGDTIGEIARFYTIAAAVEYLDGNPDIDPTSLHMGAYTIDAPFGVANDIEADKLLYDLGYRLHAMAGGSWTYSDPQGRLWDGGGKREAVVMIALKQAADAEEA